MFRKSLKFTLYISAVCVSLAVPLRYVYADIITDIDQLEPDKKLEKKKPVNADTDAGSPSASPASAKKTGKKAKSPPKDKDKDSANDVVTPQDLQPGSTESQMPPKADMIPEPTDDSIGPSKPVNPLAGTSKGKGKSKEQRVKSPVHYQSEGVTTYSRDRSTVTLQKKVMITQDDMRLQSDDAKVTLMPKKAAPMPDGGGVKNAILDGNVGISRYSTDPSERMNAKSEKAIFDNLAQIVTLEGNARLWRDGNLIKGDRIIYEIATGEIKVDKAQGVVQPDRVKK